MCDDCSSKNLVLDFVQSDEEDEVGLKCSCCGVDFKRKSLDESLSIDLTGSDLVSDHFGGKHEIQKQGKETESAQDLEFFLDYSGNQLVPVESIDPAVDEDQEFGDFQKAQVVSEPKIETVTEELLNENQETHFVLQDARELLSVTEKTEDLSKFSQLDSMEFEETENSLVFHVNLSGYPDENSSISEPTQTPSDSKELQETEVEQTGVQETEGSDSDNEEAGVSIGTEIPILDSCDKMKAQDNFNLYSLSHEEEEPSTSSHNLDFNLEYGFEETEEDEKTEELMIERKESMVDESFDGHEMDGGDPINAVEKLKSALRAERKALQALYVELEEERSASAVAASETMAMINRLQEEKAAMQMEASHYQRMMEEQSEYDQEALQLLNELMEKKEKELELYRKKVLDYETKERMRFSTSSVKSGTCSASCSHSEDGDGIWVDQNHETKEEEILNRNQENRSQNTPVDTILNPDSSFVDFEDERMSILEQLKVLEEKLFTLSDEEDRHFGDLRQMEDYFEENGKHLNGVCKYDGQEVNGNGQEVNGNGQEFNAIGSTGNRPFPLFNALETESDDGVITSNGNGNGFHSHKVENTAVTRFELQKRRIDVEEEVDQLYTLYGENGGLA
ncbi:hypothetical protein L1987_11079 [Smallanthus sonchifolius]|uniref:Uncharacterized protein n=1 Tax=Smallanthus sonchifolius TaxID=185202 RepID=A0ACB9JAI7_9ASTR|nr:hypothetical protein L1987_11079 [Smallanthus sonchifolius]